MYSYEERLRAVELYLKLGKRPRAVIRQLGYATKSSLRLWCKEFEKRGDLPASYSRLATPNPGLLDGRWRLLYERVRLDESLWIYPSLTLDDIEQGVDDSPVLDEVQLRRRW